MRIMFLSSVIIHHQCHSLYDPYPHPGPASVLLAPMTYKRLQFPKQIPCSLVSRSLCVVFPQCALVKQPSLCWIPVHPLVLSLDITTL